MRLPNPRIAYSDLKVRSANSLELVIMLNDMLTADLHSAVSAIHDQNVELRTNELNHALRVVEQLQGGLNIEEGGSTAKQLDRFYDFVRARILEAQLRSSSTHLQELIGTISIVRSAWAQMQIDQCATNPNAPAALTSAQAENTQASWTA
jgi:flagellar secretion chaperone FliS